MEGVVEQQVTLSIDEVARRLGIGRNQAYNAAHRGEIPSIRIGKRMLVPLAAFEAMLRVRSRQEIVASELIRRLQQGEPDASPSAGTHG